MSSPSPPHGIPSPRVAIIGAGKMGYWHGQTARRLGVALVSIIDKDAQRANVLARTLRVDVAETDAMGLPKEHCFDAVHICAPLATHAFLTGWAIEAGIHVFVEKPLAASAAETQSLFNRALRRAIVVCPVHQIGFQNGVAYAAQVLPRLGDVSAIDIRICSAGGMGRAPSELDDIVGEILPHPLSVLRKLWPDAAWQPELWSVVHQRQGELLVSGEHAGALLSMLVSMHARPTCFEMNLYCSKGVVHLDCFHGFALRHDGRVSRLRKMARPFSASSKLFGSASVNLLLRGLRGETAYPGLLSLTRAFYGAVRGENPSPVPPNEAVAVAVARDAILAKAAQPMPAFPNASMAEAISPISSPG
jgi:predicted dehydrogenase